MKHIRRLLAVCLCLILIASASVASAAVSKTFTKVPTVKVSSSLSKRGIETDAQKEYTVTASDPGFLEVNLLDVNDMLLHNLVSNFEIRSGANVFDFVARDTNGNPLIPGEYKFSLKMINQFGVESKEVLYKFNVREMSEETIAEAAERAAALAAAQAAAVSQPVNGGYAVVIGDGSGVTGSTVVDSAVTGSAVAGASATSVPVTVAATPIPADITYAAGNYVMGDEGLQIGVGAPDVAAQQNAGYWTLTAASSDAEIWAAITKTMTAVNVGEQESAYIYDSTKEGRKKIGTVSGFSQGLNLITERSDGWSLVEAFRNEDGAFVRGYIRSNKLRTVEPDQNYGLVIDKESQTLIVYRDGQRVGSAPICTGLATTKYPHRETPAGEFVLATRRGTMEYYGQGFSKYTIRINGSYHLSEIPTTKKNGSNFSILEGSLGHKATRGNICVAHTASADGGINAEWLWGMTDGRKRVKVLIFDDKPRTDVPVTK